MKSPVTDKEMRLEMEERTLTYRKEQFEVYYHYYFCEDSKEKFTNDDLDTLNLNQVYNQYRARYGIPFTDEIKFIREKYELSAAKMSEVLGLGTNVYRHYESGEMPSVATGRLIRLAADPHEFRKLLEMGKNALTEHEYERVSKKIDHSAHGWGAVNEHLEQVLFGNKLPGIYNGFRMPRLDKIGCMVSFFAKKNRPFTTAMNKLMFYADFGHFKKHGTSISGLCYNAIRLGPVPMNYGSIYDQLTNRAYIKIEEKEFDNFVGEQFFEGHVEINNDETLFIDSEMEILKKVAEKFKGMNTKQMAEISHEEDAWQSNIEDEGKINYVHSFRLKHI